MQTIQKKLILFMVMLLPYQSILKYLLKVPEPLLLWRDFIIIFILGLQWFIAGRQRISPLGLLILLAWIAGTVQMLLTHDPNASPSIWLNVFRVYFFPSLGAVIILNSKYDMAYLEKTKRMFIYNIAAISVFGIFQMFILGRSYTNLMGLGHASVRLGDGFQRNIGVFESANVMGIYIVFALILVIYSGQNIKYRKALMIFFALSLCLTFSMSSITALSLVMLFTWLSNLSKRRTHTNQNLRWIIGAIGGFVSLLVVDYITTGGLVTRKINERVSETIDVIARFDTTSNTLSSSVHLRSLVEPIELIRINPNGLGFATNTFMVHGKIANFLIGRVESSIYTVVFDFGLLSGFVFFLPFFYIFTLRSKKRDGTCSANLMALTTIIIYIFLPIIQNYDHRFFLFLFAGIDYNLIHQNPDILVVEM